MPSPPDRTGARATARRLPRLVLALAFGAALAVAGAVLQDALRNPLAGPEILGVSAGAAVVMALVVVFQAPPSPRS
jgi:iron complex transport system permease protein